MRLLRFILTLFAVLAVSNTAAFAQDTASPLPCVATEAVAWAPVTVDTLPTRWNCATYELSLLPERTYLRFQVPEGSPSPRFLAAQRGPLSSISVAAIDAAGRVKVTHHRMSDLQVVAGTDLLKIPLARTDSPPREIIVAVDLPTDLRVVRSMQLTIDDPSAAPRLFLLLLVISMLAGMLLMPLIFGLMIYRVLRHSFVLWHAVTAAALLMTVLVNSALITSFVPLGVEMIVRLAILALGLSVAGNVMFAYHFIERSRANAALRKTLPWLAAWGFLVGVLGSLDLHSGRTWHVQAYFTAYVPVLIAYIWFVVGALRRGSRYSRYLIVGLSPLIAVCLLRLVGQLTPWLPENDSMLLFYVGCVFEEITAMLGVTARLVQLRKERDRARIENAVLQNLSRHDPLTGLMNRHALESDPQDQIEFTAMAIMDIDHFKSINDTYGHVVGDRVLKAVADVLKGEEDARIVRMGGEEFLIQLRCSRPGARAEAFRRAIPLSVGRAVPELDWPVTASMGVILLGPKERDQIPDFQTLYSRMDGLLYRAKDQGRDRSVVAKLAFFDPDISAEDAQEKFDSIVTSFRARRRKSNG
ncbi:GGDEF domain-containing protein [Qipengyuania qiaonensis]|uniref:diguanylate cyclase n=1 Tax=Qipengyuania qiaonensis TaxID=2867240 RepID=A0ABS7J9D5_9SPHN|nr:diguanylate cyclase [Qipengyuania qiaonensis]MBX7482489.1 GGDEF domain-containing protein [Qipengyuania qiaonensis]